MTSIFRSQDQFSSAGFWRRQFSSLPTPYQIVFDVIFGIAMPIICFYLDPGIIRAGPLIGYAILIYSMSAIAMFTLIVWLFLATRIKAVGAIISGILMSGAVCSFTIGVVILPFTVIGLFLIIGILGLVPFVTGFVYLRNAIRAVLFPHATLRGSALAGAVSIGLLLGTALPVLGDFTLSRIVADSMNQIRTQQDPRALEVAVQRLKYFGWGTDLDKLVRAYESESNPEVKDNLAKAYKSITGKEIVDRLRVLND